MVPLELGYDALKNISKSLVESTQTGELGSTLNLTIDVINVSEPAKDPELVVFNINDTGKKEFIFSFKLASHSRSQKHERKLWNGCEPFASLL